MATVARPDEALALGRDLRTVIRLLTGVRLSEDACVTLVCEVLEGAATPRHEACVYLLATHLLALDERPSLDALAWTWLAARGEHPWTVRRAADALKLAIFSVESGWHDALVRRLLTLVAQSRDTPLWVDLTDLARAGGRHARVLRPLVFRADPWRPEDPARAAALMALSGAHELHRIRTVAGEGFAIVANRAPDVRSATAFTATEVLPAPAESALSRLVAEGALLHAVHAFPGGVRPLSGLGDPRVVILPGHADDVVAAAARPLARALSTAANLPSVLALPPQHVLSVFPSGHRLASEARWWAAGRRRRQAR